MHPRPPGRSLWPVLCTLYHRPGLWRSPPAGELHESPSASGRYGRPQLEGRIVRTQKAIHEALQRGPPIRSGTRLFHSNIHGEELRHGIPRQGAPLRVVNNLVCVGQLAARRIFADEFITFPMAAPERIVVLLGVVRAGNNGRGFVGHSHAVVAEVRG